MCRQLAIILIISSCHPALADASEGEKPVRKDLYGNPLPEGAVARLGTVRLRPATRVTFSPDGKTIASCSGGKGIYLWDVATGKEIRHFAEQFRANWIAFSPDGKSLASASGLVEDKAVRLWDVTTGKEIRQWHHEGCNSLAFSPDGSTLASGGRDKTVRLWEVSTSKQIHQLRNPDEVWSIAWSPDGKTLASGCGNGAICLWEATSGAQRHKLVGHQQMVGRLAWSHDGSLFASGGEDGIVRIWKAATGKEYRAIGLATAGSNPQQERGIKANPNTVGSLGWIQIVLIRDLSLVTTRLGPVADFRKLMNGPL